MEEYIGSVRCFDGTTPHEFTVHRGHGYTVRLDGKTVLSGASHNTAYAFIARECKARGYRRRSA